MATDAKPPCYGEQSNAIARYLNFYYKGIFLFFKKRKVHRIHIPLFFCVIQNNQPAIDIQIYTLLLRINKQGKYRRFL